MLFEILDNGDSGVVAFGGKVAELLEEVHNQAHALAQVFVWGDFVVLKEIEHPRQGQGMGLVVHAREGLEPSGGVLFEAYVTKTFRSHGCFDLDLPQIRACL